jgi:hypothetical protein
MTTKAKGTSVTQKLLALKEKAGVPFANISTAFLIERLVARLIADKDLRKSLVFKGGFVSMKVYASPRYTIDLDALLLKANIKETLQQTKEAAEVDLDDGVWFKFEEQVDLQTQGEYGGFRQVYRAGIGPVLKNLKKAQIVNFDLGIGDPVTPGPTKATTATLLSGKELSWSVYPIETMIAEKLHALISLGAANSRSKDVYDLSIFLPQADPKTLASALKKTFAFRSTELPMNVAGTISSLDTKALERGWESAVSTIQNAEEFGICFSKVVSLLAQIQKKF